MFKIELDSVRKQGKSASEWRMVNRARCGNYESIGDGLNIKAVCLKMYEDGADPATQVGVYRDGTLCFTYATLESWAGMGPKQPQPAHLKR